MSGGFDPYHKWLGIPPHQQPADHYRLFGLKLFEDDAEIIALAAAQRMRYVREQLDGSQQEPARSLLRELVEARNCLLDHKSKLAYDEGLRAGQRLDRTQSNVKPAAPAFTSQPVAQPSIVNVRQRVKAKRKQSKATSVSFGLRSTIAKRSQTTGDDAARKRQQPTAARVVGLVGGFMVVVLAWCFANSAFFTNGTDEVADAPKVTIRRDKILPQTENEEEMEKQEPAAPVARESGGDRQPMSETPKDVRDTQTTNRVEETESLNTGQLEAEQPEVGEEEAKVETFPYEGLVLWLDAADAERIEIDDRRHVSRWYDGSRRQNHAIQTNSAARPLFTARPGGLPLVTFAGTQWMTVEPADDFNMQDSYSILFVARGGTGVMLDKGDGYNPGAFSFWNGVTSLRTHNRTINAGAEAQDELKVRAVVADPTWLRWYVDGDLCRKSDAQHHLANEQSLLVGRRSKESDPRFFEGQIGELLVYQQSLTAGERKYVEAYLRGKWCQRNSATLPVADRSDNGESGGEPSPSGAAPADNAAVKSNQMPPLRGEVLHELWRNVPGNQVAEFVEYVAKHPESELRRPIDKLETPEDYGDNYGQRLHGYLHPPQTGEYDFSIRANAEGVVYLSADKRAETTRRIEDGSTVELDAGGICYFEAYHKESTGRDYFQIGWTLPDGTVENPIPGERLSIEHRLIPPHETQFVVLELAAVECSGDTKIELLDDGSVLATGKSVAGETYQLVTKCGMRKLTALRLEALPDNSLPAGGPGRGVGGGFALAEVSVVASESERTAKPLQVEFAAIGADESGSVGRLVDGDEKTVWRFSGRGKAAAVTFIPKRAIAFSQEIVLRVTITSRESLGCFRLLATSAADPLRLSAEAGSDGPHDSLRVNFGGDRITDPQGRTWLKSRFFDNETFGHEGGRGVMEEGIKNPVQASAQRGIAAFRAVVPNGTYDVTLYFCEYWSTDAARRRFAIAAERRVVARSFDLLHASGGFAMPLAYPIRNVAVTDGRLDIEFRPATPGASAILNAIEIQQAR